MIIKLASHREKLTLVQEYLKVAKLSQSSQVAGKFSIYCLPKNEPNPNKLLSILNTHYIMFNTVKHAF